MASIRIDLDHELLHGEELTFKAPCDCSEVNGIKVYYPSEGTTLSKTLTFRDAHGSVLTDINNLFSSGAIIKVIVDSIEGYAYILNADTNDYLEKKFGQFSRTTTALNFSNFANGTFTETLSDGTTKEHTVTFDGDGKPTAIDGMNIVW